MADPVYQLGTSVDDAELSALHRAAFGEDPVQAAGRAPDPWSARLRAHSLTWVQARVDGHLVGFANVAWDGGLHAFLLDVAVDQTWRGRGVGGELVRRTTTPARAAGCQWLHVDFEPRLQPFYARCGFSPTAAGLVDLTGG